MVRSFAKRSGVVLLSSALAGSLTACAPSVGNAIAVDKYADAGGETSSDYIINVGDTLNIMVFEQASMSGSQPVRPDGKISIPLINEVQAAGKTPAKLQADLEAALKAVVLNPRVTVGVQNPKLPTISVIGEVGRQGDVELKQGMGVAQAIAAAGGLTTFAHKNRIFVKRTTDKGDVMILFNYDDLLAGTGKAAQFRLRPSDQVIVR